MSAASLAADDLIGPIYDEVAVKDAPWRNALGVLRDNTDLSAVNAVTGPIPPTELGLTLAFSVLIVAAVVLMFIMPAAIVLLGDRTWALPAWIEKRLPNIEFNH